MTDIVFGFLFLLTGMMVLIWAKNRNKDGVFWHLNYTIPMTGVVCLCCGIYAIIRAVIEMYNK